MSAFAAGKASGIQFLGVLEHGANMNVRRLQSVAPLSFGPMFGALGGIGERRLECRSIVRLDPNVIASLRRRRIKAKWRPGALVSPAPCRRCHQSFGHGRRG